ncbi:MAG: leucyl aminopeptidase [Deltaproteobacteria bacterium]|nr:leucyl aminopeptidase [Deltaproteobacteria bacterium]
MKKVLMFKGARTLVETCAQVKEGENVLIVTDTVKFDTDIAEALAAAATAVGAEAVISVMPARLSDGEEPPKSVAEAMKKSEVFFTPVDKSITHTLAVKEALSAGARAIMMSDYTEDLLISGGIEADFNALEPICDRVVELFTKAKKAELTTPGGTRVTMNIEGRKGRVLRGIIKPGEFGAIPNIEAGTSPIEGTAEGVIIADASVPYLGIGVLSQPIRVTVKKGIITEIEGGEEARKLQEDLANRSDPNVYNIAEIAVGLNPKARFCGIMMEDEGVLGSAHIGFGTNIMHGGNIKTELHYDLIMRNATIKLDDSLIVENGILKV